MNNVKLADKVKVKVKRQDLPDKKSRVEVVVKLIEAIRTLRNLEAWQTFALLHLEPNREAVRSALRQEYEPYKVYRLQGALGAIEHNLELPAIERQYVEELVRLKKRSA